MVTKHSPRHVERSTALAKELLVAWKMPTTKADVEQWSKYLCHLGDQYKLYLKEYDLESSKSDTGKQRPIRQNNLSLLIEISCGAIKLVDALKKAKKKPNFINQYLHIDVIPGQNFQTEDELLSDLEFYPSEGFHDIPIIASLELLSIKAIIEADISLQANTTPRRNSFIYGHPTIRLIKLCLYFLELAKSNDPIKQVDKLAFSVHALMEKEDHPPGWEDYIYQFKAWWNLEGRELWKDVLAFPDGDTSGHIPLEARNAYTKSLNKLLDEIRRRDLETDLGELGGVSPDPRKMRGKKQGTPRLPQKMRDV